MQDLLEKSIRQYRQLHDLTLALEAPLSCQDAERLCLLTAEIEKIKATIVQTDIEINRKLDSNQAMLTSDLYARRFDLMMNIFQKNKKLAPRIQAMMAVHNSELDKIRHGINSIGHYAVPVRQSGRIIDTAN